MTKSYTDLEQSKKLAYILPLESADMYWSFGNIKFMDNDYDSNVAQHIPAWSFTALLSVLPKGECKDIDLCNGGYQGDKYIPEWFCSYEQQEPFVIEVCHADNPVDACYDMVMRLNELNLL